MHGGAFASAWLKLQLKRSCTGYQASSVLCTKPAVAFPCSLIVRNPHSPLRYFLSLLILSCILAKVNLFPILEEEF
jgi:hypothetical protein